MVESHREQTPRLADQQIAEEALESQYQRYLEQRQAQLLTRLVHALRPNQLVRSARRLGYALTPQLARTLIWSEQAPKIKSFPTSYLNGLRGVTAVKVFTFHYSFVYSDFGFQPWGVDDRHKHFLELPVIRYFYSGFTSHVFFGIAGYLTALRIFQQLDCHDSASHSKVLLNISGSLFRRALRLYLPVFIITFITATYIHCGYYESNRAFILDHEKLFPGDWYEPKPEMYATWAEQLGHWCHGMFDLTNIVSEHTVYPYHDQHLWSILSEMRASLHLYGILIAVVQCRKHVRIMVMGFLAFMYFLWNHWETWVYILGAIVAQIDLLLTQWDKEERESMQIEKDMNGHAVEPGPEPRVSQPTREWPTMRTPTAAHDHTRSAIRWLAFLLAFYLLSYPIDGARDYAPGYIYLNRLIPDWMMRKDKFYPNIGTAIFILLLARSDPDTSRWRRALTSPIPQYLGKISFALYLVHGPIMHAIGYLIPHKICWFRGTELISLRDLPWALTIFAGWAITLVLSLWAADVWTREVEARCVKFVKELEEVCFVKS